MNGQNYLKLAGVLSFAIALLHIVIIFIGASAYRYFEAGEEMASLAEQGSWQPALLTSAIVLAFIVFGVYAWSGAGIMARLPWLRIVLIVISAIYLLRGSAIIIQLVWFINSKANLKDIVFSLVSLVTGVCYAVGVKLLWQNLK